MVSFSGLDALQLPLYAMSGLSADVSCGTVHWRWRAGGEPVAAPHSGSSADGLLCVNNQARLRCLNAASVSGQLTSPSGSRKDIAELGTLNRPCARLLLQNCIKPSCPRTCQHLHCAGAVARPTRRLEVTASDAEQASVVQAWPATGRRSAKWRRGLRVERGG